MIPIEVGCCDLTSPVTALTLLTLLPENGEKTGFSASSLLCFLLDRSFFIGFK